MYAVTQFHSFVILGVLLILLSSNSLAWLPENGVAICTVNQDQQLPEITTDGKGGAIIVWQDSRFSTSTVGYGDDIYIQRIDKLGNPVWLLNGISIASGSRSQYYPKVIPDDTGGAIVAWHQNYRIYTQRVNSMGSTLWDLEGVAIMTTNGYTYLWNLISDGNSGAIVVWMDNLYTTNYNIRSQRISKDGQILWGENGIAICTARNNQVCPDLVPDGEGGTIICWADYREDYFGDIGRVYVQRVNSQGSSLWTQDGIEIDSEFPYIYDFDYFPSIVSDNQGGAIVTWGDSGSSTRTRGVYAQRINSNGSTLWLNNSISTSTPYVPFYLEIVSDGENGAIIGWPRGNSIQKVNGLGEIQWDLSGVWASTTYSFLNEIVMIPDNNGGAIACWIDSNKVMAQYINSSGNKSWGELGIAICSTNSDLRHARMINDGYGGAIVTWQDKRNENRDIYAQIVDFNGNWQPPNPPSKLITQSFSSSQIQLIWRDESNDEIGFGIDYKISNQGIWNVLTTVNSNNTTIVHTGLSKGQTYCYRVYAYNGAGISDYSNISCTIAGVPQKPDYLTARLISNKQSILTWKDISNNEYGFGIDYRIDNGDWFILDWVGPNQTTYAHSGLSTQHNEYAYRVYAYNNYGLSVYSNITFINSPPFTINGYCFDTSSFLITEISKINVYGSLLNIKNEDDYIYITNYEKGIHIIDIKNLSNSYLISTFTTQSGTKGLELKNNLLLYGDISSRLHIVDISNPKEPTLMSHLNLHGNSMGIQNIIIHGNLAYISDTYSGLRIVDILNPYDPYEIGSYDTDGLAFSTFVIDSIAYIADRDNGLVILNVADPSHPIFMNHISSLDKTFDVVVRGNFAYLAEGTYGLRILSLENPLNPVEIIHFDTPELAIHVYIEGNYLYLVDYDNGIYLMDISNPYSPSQIGFYASNNYVLTFRDNFVFLPLNYEGFKIINTAKPLSNILISLSGDKNQIYTTDTQGYFEYVNLNYGNYMIDPTNDEYLFSPYFRNYSKLDSDMYSQNFIGRKLIFNPPSNLLVNSVSNKDIKLTWKDNSDNEWGFGIDVQINDGNWSVLAFVGANQTTYTHINLIPGRTYCYRVYAYTSTAQSDYSNIVCIKSGVPSSPTHLVLSSQSPNSIQLSWQDNSNNEYGFGIDMKIDNGNWEVLEFIAPNLTTYIHHNLIPGHTYGYRVYGWNQYGLSEYSNEAYINIESQPLTIPSKYWDYNFD